MAINIPFRLWNEDTAKLDPPDVEAFADAIEALASDFDVLILYCLSGGRSTGCTSEFDTDLFFAVYDINNPEGSPGFGGFEGSSYGNAYNGYRGFPGRRTRVQTVPSVSWKDAGLPMETWLDPFVIPAIP